MQHSKSAMAGSRPRYGFSLAPKRIEVRKDGTVPILQHLLVLVSGVPTRVVIPAKAGIQ